MVLENGVELYERLYDWLTSISCGDYRRKSSYKYYQEKLWNPILNKLDELSRKDRTELSYNEEIFLNNILYKGKIYRKMRYRSKRRGHIYEMSEYASWSRDIEGVMNVPGLNGEVLLLIGYTNKGISVQALLHYFYNFKIWKSAEYYKCIDNLCRYINEKEIVAPILFENIEDIKIIDLKSIDKEKGVSLERDKWRRNRI